MSGAAATSPIFLPYQSRVMQAVREERVVVVEKSRRTGLSWAASFIADLTAAASRAAGGMDVFYMGYNLEMAREFIDYCAEHAQVMQGVTGTVREDFFADPDRPEKDIKVFRIDFASGHKVLALPSMPRALRGMQGLVILDEAAFHDDLEDLLKAAMALLMWGGRVLIISTHNGDQNPFNGLVTDIRSGRSPYHLIRITLDDAISEGIYRKIAAAKGEDYSPQAERAWRDEIYAFYGDKADEELDCIPSPTSGAYLPLALIEARQSAESVVLRWACESAFALMPEGVRERECARWCEEVLKPHLDRLDPATPHVFGEDFGRIGDLTVIWVLALLRSLVRHTPFTVELRNVPFDQQRQILFFIIDHLPRFRAGKMDARGNGQYLAEVTVQRYGASIEAVMLSEPWYRENMPPLKAAFEDGAITVPADRDTQDDLRSLTIVRGVARVPESRAQDKTGKRHGDAAVAACLAIAASRAEPEAYEYRAAPSPFALDRAAAGGGSRWPIEDEIAGERARGRGGIDGYGLRGGL